MQKSLAWNWSRNDKDWPHRNMKLVKWNRNHSEKPESQKTDEITEERRIWALALYVCSCSSLSVVHYFRRLKPSKWLNFGKTVVLHFKNGQSGRIRSKSSARSFIFVFHLIVAFSLACNSTTHINFLVHQSWHECPHFLIQTTFIRAPKCMLLCKQVMENNRKSFQTEK